MAIEGTELVPEGEGMAETTPTLAARATGSTGDAPIADSITRGIFAAAITSPAQWLLVRFVADFTAEDWQFLAPAFMVGAFVLYGLFDRFVKGRLLGS